MTIVFLQPDGVPITAQAERQGSAALYGGGSGRPLGGRSGFRVGTPTDTLAATSTTWTLKPCSAMIDPGASTHQGMYGWATDANITGTVTASDATYGRKDIVYIQINDSTAGDGSGATTAPVLYLAGTPSASPSAPALPARSFLVGTIDVPKTGAGSPTVTLNPARFAAAGAPLQVKDASERDGLDKFDGLTVRRMDIAGRPEETWDGSGWNRQNAAVTYANTQFVGSGMNSNNFTSGTSRRVDQGGTFVGITDAQGYLLIGYPAIFPNGVIMVGAWNGDASVNRKAKMDVTTAPFTNDLTKFYVSVVDSSTGNPISNTTVRCNWIAMGW